MLCTAYDLRLRIILKSQPIILLRDFTTVSVAGIIEKKLKDVYEMKNNVASSGGISVILMPSLMGPQRPV